MKGIARAGTTRHDVIGPDSPAAARPACTRERLGYHDYSSANSDSRAASTTVETTGCKTRRSTDIA